jgi:hypothetical protein
MDWADYLRDETAKHRQLVETAASGIAYIPKTWQPLNVLIAAEQALASARGD